MRREPNHSPTEASNLFSKFACTKKRATERKLAISVLSDGIRPARRAFRKRPNTPT